MPDPAPSTNLSTRRRLPLLALLVTAASVAPALHAHPFSETEYSLKTEMLADDRGVHLQITLEVPIAVVMEGLADVRSLTDPRAREAAVRADQARRLRGLADQARIHVDGRPLEVPFTPVDTLANGKAAEGFFVYLVEAEVAGGRIGTSTRLHVEHRGYEQVPMVYAAEGEARSPFTLVEDGAATARREVCPDGTCAATEGFTRDARLKSPTWVLSRAPR